ncbi:MAG: isoleucine--tRNA ligase [Deltaproteobacteria bacterium]|nr:isoleucine--tRNA ligase [Candidatus Anaeroferrophillus wilburensis]MBN2890083.1 isoleucine--tRNA ligase [Deltaproteobacteria bacterium]
MDYKETLNLPQTRFPMRGNLVQREPESIRVWEERAVYRRLLERRAAAPAFVLHDGPPYANGHLHMGHALNKILKDIILKARSMAGCRCHYVPGWDCHGLPIEHQVDKDLGRRKAEMSQVEVRQACRDYAAKFIAIQRDEFERLGIFGEWDNPYLTMNYPYEGAIVRELAKFAGNGGLYKRKKPIYWCSTCQTALAEAEVEYEDETSPSIYVKFALEDDLSATYPFLAGQKVFLVIWTTTPWTIPANLAIALHPDLVYEALQVDDEVYIVAEGLREKFCVEAGLDRGDVLGTVNPKDFERCTCRHPLYERQSLIIMGDHVTLEAGTGCVHTAPGHGQEDYEVGLAYGLDVYAPVDDQGRFTDEVEFFAGQFVFAANPAVIAKLEECGALVASKPLSHSYPHCWRCKKAIIFRSTEQWFISMERNDLRQRALEAINQVTWIPTWGRERIYGMVENRPDWCISRQRVWGVPIPVFYCRQCGRPLIDEQLMNRVADVFAEQGADVWFAEDAAFFLPPATVCPDCGHDVFDKETDILDVWFDSGVSYAAVLKARDYLEYPADLYLEGSDQHRGWFHSSLLASVGARGTSPYKAVLTHGFVVDGAGKKMSKSAGNVISPEKVVKKYGAEILRLWVAAQDYRDDIRISEEILSRLVEAYRRIRNTLRFLLANLFDYDPAVNAVDYGSMEELDQWALHQVCQLQKKVLAAYEAYEFHAIYHAIHNFCVVELSGFYLDVVKDRLYITAADSSMRRSTQTALHLIVNALVRMCAPILSFTADEVWQHMPAAETDDSIFLHEFLLLPESCFNPQLAAVWSGLLDIRKTALKKLETARQEKLIGLSLDARLQLAARGETLELLQRYQPQLTDIFMVSQVEVLVLAAGEKGESDEQPDVKVTVAPAAGDKCQRCWRYSTMLTEATDNHPGICDRCRQQL